MEIIYGIWAVVALACMFANLKINGKPAGPLAKILFCAAWPLVLVVCGILFLAGGKFKYNGSDV